MNRRTLQIACMAVLSLSAGCALGNAILTHRLPLVVISGTCLVVGIALVVALLRAQEDLPAGIASELEHREAYEAAWTSAPRLGEVLVHKYHWITEKDLSRALTYQRHAGGRVGEILVRMRAITKDQLAQALFEQRMEAGGAYPTPIQGWSGLGSEVRETATL